MTTVSDVIADIVDLALYSDWCVVDKAYWDHQKAPTFGTYGEKVASILDSGGEVYIRDMVEHKSYRMDLNSILNGFNAWEKDGCDSCGVLEDGDIHPEQLDTITADMIMQYALFGELVYD